MMWPKRKPCLKLKKTNPGFLGEETEPHLATTFFQGVVESGKVSTFPPLRTRTSKSTDRTPVFAFCLPKSR